MGLTSLLNMAECNKPGDSGATPHGAADYGPMALQRKASVESKVDYSLISPINILSGGREKRNM